MAKSDPNERKMFRLCCWNSGIAVVGGLIISFFGRPIDSAAMLYIISMINCFYVVAQLLQGNRERVEKLEARINELEGKRAAA